MSDSELSDDEGELYLPFTDQQLVIVTSEDEVDIVD